MENRLADFCLLGRGCPPKLVELNVKPLVNFIVDSMVPAFSAGEASHENNAFVSHMNYVNFMLLARCMSKAGRNPVSRCMSNISQV
jgi:hypothetical protein